jgi:uncharacterized protein YhbP (UPF0306 family)
MTADALEVPAHVLEYLSEQSTVTIATCSPGAVPHASTFLYVNDGAALYFWTRPSGATARHIERNPIVSFTVDERSADLRQARGVQGTGEARVVTGEPIARVAALFGDKFPTLAPGQTLSIVFYCIIPTDLQFIDNTEGGGARAAGMFGAEFHRKRAYSVFSDLPVRDAEAIAVAMRTERAEAGETIVRQDDPAERLFVLVEGEAEVTRADEDRTETLGTLRAGNHFGGVSLVHGTRAPATVTATAASTLLVLDHDGFRDLVAQSLGTTADFDRVVQERLESIADHA